MLSVLKVIYYFFLTPWSDCLHWKVALDDNDDEEEKEEEVEGFVVGAVVVSVGTRRNMTP